MRRLGFAALFTLLAAHAAFATPAEHRVVLASWYGSGFAGREMADGGWFNPNDPTIAASRTLPLGTRIRVTNLENGRSLVMKVRDRGPFVRRNGRLVKKRALDVSSRAAKLLGFTGVIPVTIKVLPPAPQELICRPSYWGGRHARSP